MVLADETPHEEQTVNQNFSSPISDNKTSPKVGDSFICIKEVRSVSRAKALRLKIGDVISIREKSKSLVVISDSLAANTAKFDYLYIAKVFE